MEAQEEQSRRGNSQFGWRSAIRTVRESIAVTVSIVSIIQAFMVPFRSRSNV
ncbi:hypothetical protein D1872_310990 [compost metagenome]